MFNLLTGERFSNNVRVHYAGAVRRRVPLDVRRPEVGKDFVQPKGLSNVFVDNIAFEAEEWVCHMT